VALIDPVLVFPGTKMAEPPMFRSSTRLNEADTVPKPVGDTRIPSAPVSARKAAETERLLDAADRIQCRHS
jgi:hypothetical protein